MARFDVYRTPDGEGYLLDVQADTMSHFNTRVVVPLMAVRDAPKVATRLNPVFVIEGTQHSMVTQYLGTIPAKELRQVVLSLRDRYDEIVAAIDLLLQGF
ncbi:CcdB family protein [Paraburkholderia sp. MMS20-SJTR3]|uniref:Toxin CcdB n=1 Tax=Paraburkholderia sejongensis TaxID=2886946 RepID=A0ABS8JV55_9BURK|nr:CcdB family protein [Paraburkholderia sp. MMS20-SJTR3]MCC8393777.1 CcdB family protein [Paraburkholderia sp. MMS20-SJTR3]